MAVVKGTMETELQIAERIARSAHTGQVEESTCDDYIERVVALVEGKKAKAVAWLHDVLEDTPLDGASLLEGGISDRVVAAVTRLTRLEEEPYIKYIQRIKKSGDNLALAVKIADLQDHLRPNCPKRLRPRYEKALWILGGKSKEPKCMCENWAYELKHGAFKEMAMSFECPLHGAVTLDARPIPAVLPSPSPEPSRTRLPLPPTVLIPCPRCHLPHGPGPCPPKRVMAL